VIVSRSFLGISTEYWTIPTWAKHMSLLRRVFSLITQEGPVVLRIGGNSADRSMWSRSVCRLSAHGADGRGSGRRFGAGHEVS
jgi:hypothetical protein